MLQLPASIEQGSSKVGAFAYSLAGLSVLIASVLSFYSMFLHLKNYRRPDLQRLIIRILWMVPVYAVASFVSLSSKYASYYIDTIRDVYEAFVIYSFFTFLINYLGGERALLSLLQERLRIHHLWPFHHFFSPMDISDPDTFLFYVEGPMPKFICVKAIIFLTFWQGLFVAFLVAAGVISGSDQDELYSANNIALALQDVMICFEMPFFVWLHWYAFPWTDFDDSRLSSRVTLWYAVRDALGIKDLVQDTYYVFVNPPDLTRPFLRPSYRSYAETHSVAHWIEDEDEFTDTYYGSSSRNESSPLASSNNNERLHIGPSRQGRLYLGSDDENTAMLLEFSDPSEEEEQDYVQARQFVFGDFNFPVVHEDPRYHHPPQVRRIIEQHATHFNEQVAHRGANPGVSRELNSQAGYGSNGDQISPTSAAAHASDSRARSDFILVDDKENRSIGTSE
ncbi:hypothetical protein BASA60_000411 [Batrachochytrium salamandrivorans]|nr:hypothetical protein BASA60_000411 [Batrachochytrium salamandrivorans]